MHLRLHHLFRFRSALQSFIDDGAHSLLCPLQRGPVVLFSKLQGDDLLFSRRQGSLKVNNLDGGLLSSHHEFGSQLAFSLTRTRDAARAMPTARSCWLAGRASGDDHYGAGFPFPFATGDEDWLERAKPAYAKRTGREPDGAVLTIGEKGPSDAPTNPDRLFVKVPGFYQFFQDLSRTLFSLTSCFLTAMALISAA